jgi:hypothetical protein
MVKRSHRCVGSWLALCIACAIGCGDDDDAVEPGREDAAVSCVPTGEEVCDSEHLDEDCDPSTLGELDRDDDGATDARCCNTDPAGVARCGGDCYDLSAAVHPDAEEVCDGYDNDCDGETDEDTQVRRYRDKDGDGHGSKEEIEVCDGAPGSASVDDDCDDRNATVHPGMPELCDEIDNDCDGAPERADEVEDVVWYLDGDGDGFGVTNSPVGISCAPPPFPVLCLEWLPLEFCTAGDPKKFMVETEGMMSQHHQDGVLDFAIVAGDCDDINPFIHPGASEVCDGQDDDCNGRADYRVGPNDFEDDDGDFVLDAACERQTLDCDDMDPASAPGRDEVCDRFDNDCDGNADEELESAELFPDRDGDGYGDDSAMAIMACSQIAGHVATGGDCDDRQPGVHPDRRELCDTIDQDCDGLIDEQLGGCGAPARVAGVVARAEDAVMRVEGARVTAYDLYGVVLDQQQTRASGRFDLDVPTGPVVVSIEPPEASDLVGLVRVILAPAVDLDVPLDAAARWDEIARASDVARNPGSGLLVAEFLGPTPAGGQGMLIAPGGGSARARVGNLTVDGPLLPAYGPPQFAPPGQAFASVSYYNLEPGLYNPMLTEVLACHSYAVSELSTAPSPNTRLQRVVSWPVLPDTITIMRVDCTVALDTCCSGWGEPGCKNDLVETCVCAQEPSCCTSGWDEACAELVTSGGCSQCSTVVPHGGACCNGSEFVGCALEPVEQCVCQVLPECCQGPWDRRCAGAISSLRCGYCPNGFNGEFVPGSPDAGAGN